MPSAALEPTEACPGCGSVLVQMAGDAPAHPGASASCTRLFETTLRGLREEAGTEPSAAAVVGLADAAYDAQHPVDGEPDRLTTALTRLAEAAGAGPAPNPGPRPPAWRATIADVAADLDVIDLPALVGSWAQSVHQDWCGAGARL